MCLNEWFVKSSVSINFLDFSHDLLLIIKMTIKHIDLFLILIYDLLNFLQRSACSVSFPFQLELRVIRMKRVFSRICFRNINYISNNSLSINPCCNLLIPYEFLTENVLIVKLLFPFLFSLKEHQLNVFVNCEWVHLILFKIFVDLLSVLYRNLT